MNNYYIAIDIGASSGRVMLGYLENNKINIEEIYRFTNGVEKVNNHLCWNLNHLTESIINGLKKAKALDKIPKTIAIDTWGVDFVLLDDEGNPLGDSISYRDKRTEGVPSEFFKQLSKEDLYSITGIQEQSFNTLYQLIALKKENPELLNKAKHFLQIPDYLSYVLTGNISNEYTNATTTNLVNLESKCWDWNLLDKIGVPRRLFKKTLMQPGTVKGQLLTEISKIVGYQCKVISAASHDTASAFLAIPIYDDNSICISSGTWSLLGIENDKYITSEKARVANFTNEGGYNNTIRFLKNIMGLWMIQSCKKNWGSIDSYATLEKLAREADINNTTIIDVNEEVFLSPDSMVSTVKKYCRENNLTTPETKGEVILTLYKSLSKNYESAIQELSEITEKKYTSINIVGGGSYDSFLNQLTSDATNLPVYAGPTEGTALGNFIIQLISNGEIKDIISAREIIKNSFEIKKYTPTRRQ